MTTHSLSLTIGRIIALVDVLKGAYEANGFYVSEVLGTDVDIATLCPDGRKSYTLREAEKQAGQRVVIADLITQITGESFGDPIEDARIRALRRLVDRVAAGEDADAVAAEEALLSEAF